jgi:diaminohydroxyphosphoribosylaminopyrimidine deaminase/5-amino-6-(5-phosphoribosylamino)uracil reductase
VLTAKEEHPKRPNTEYIQLDFGRDILPQIMEVLRREKLQSLMVEGGSILLQSFIDAGCWDEAYIEQSEDRLWDGVKSPSLPTLYDFLTFQFAGKKIRYAVRTSPEPENTIE